MLLWHFMNASSSGSCSVYDVSMAAQAYEYYKLRHLIQVEKIAIRRDITQIV
jgi:hypothetical protein